MPKTKLQEVVFTILMVFVMVYAMICYNISLNMGGMSNIVFLNAFHEYCAKIRKTYYMTHQSATVYFIK